MPHVRAYTARGLRRLFDQLPVEVVYRTRVFPGYDKLAARSKGMAGLLRVVTYALEHTPLRAFGLSHFLVLRRKGGSS